MYAVNTYPHRRVIARIYMARGRSWRLLRLALLWARRGGALKRAFVADFVRRLVGSSDKGDRCMFSYGEHEFSFDKTPLFRRLAGKSGQSRSMRVLRRITCLGKDVEEEEEEVEEMRGVFSTRSDESTTTTAEGVEEDEDEEEEEEEKYFGDAEEEEEEGVDAKAEVFIARFYEQLKLQRQMSLIECHERTRIGS